MKTDENSLKSYFERFGKVVDCIVMRDQSSKRSRGFGFVSFEESSALEEAQRNRPHKIDDKEVPLCYISCNTWSYYRMNSPDPTLSPAMAI